MLGFYALLLHLRGRGLVRRFVGQPASYLRQRRRWQNRYSLYYYGLEVIGLVFAWRYGRRATQPRIRQAL